MNISRKDAKTRQDANEKSLIKNLFATCDLSFAALRVNYLKEKELLEVYLIEYFTQRR